MNFKEFLSQIEKAEQDGDISKMEELARFAFKNAFNGESEYLRWIVENYPED